MKKIYTITILFSVLLTMVDCTGDFEDYNTNPYGVTDEQLEADYNNVGAYFTGLQRYIYNYSTGLQVEQNLFGDAYAQYFVPPSSFLNGINSVTYYMPSSWTDDTWDNKYDHVMAVIYQFDKDSVGTTYPNFGAWATVLKIFAMQRVTDFYGPIIYSDYGSQESTVHYDSQESIYAQFFEELDEAIATLSEYADAGSESFANYDLAYGGDVSKWVKAANSLRLRLAMRIANVDPEKAQEEAEAAVNQQYGVMTSNDDNFYVALGSNQHPIYIFSSSWTDCRMGATVGSILGGYGDPRLEVFFDAATDAEVTGQYIGIRQGITLTDKTVYVNFSAVGTDWFGGATSVKVMNAAEVQFLLAEGALRGWDMGGSAQDFYEAGVTLSFAEFGVSGAGTYLEDQSSTFADYTDPKNSDNDFSASSDITIAWEDGDSDERKLERIITQKWIAVFPDGQESWSEFRRTGYPQLIPVVDNYSGGGVSAGDFIRRVTYPIDEYSTNAGGVAEGVQLLGGDDVGGTRLWWDTDAIHNGNF